MTYEEAVNKNLRDCFDKNEKFIRSSKYIDPDKFTEETVTVKPKIIFDSSKEYSVKLKSDGLLSISKFDKIKCADSEMSDKDFYAYFRVGMKDCLKWPAYGWSLNKARKVCGNDDRLDILLDYLHTFYNLCEDYDGDLENFKNIISRELPAIKSAILNENTLIWLCSFANFKDFIDTSKLNVFVDVDPDNSNEYITERWENYYCELYERVGKFKSTM